jgi:broad specificity phosphatase PhoE
LRVIDPSLIEGLDGAQRQPFTQAYWDDPDPDRRMGREADTFAEFDNRVSLFIEEMALLPDTTVIFGHGIWFSLLTWRLQGHRAEEAEDMRRFRRFQLSVSMPNCAVFSLIQTSATGWSVTETPG